MECPNCKLINPPTAQRCDCGYDFPSGTMKESYLPNTERKKKVAGTTWIGAIIALALRLMFATPGKHLWGKDPFLIIALIVGAIGIVYWFILKIRGTHI